MKSKGYTKEELVELVEKIIEVQGSEEEVDHWIEIVAYNVPHPNPSDLIFWNNEDLTAAQIVERALSYKSIQL